MEHAATRRSPAPLKSTRRTRPCPRTTKSKLARQETATAWAVTGKSVASSEPSVPRVKPRPPARVIERTDSETADRAHLTEHTEDGAKVLRRTEPRGRSDQWPSRSTSRGHQHSVREYVNGQSHTDGVERCSPMVKRRTPTASTMPDVWSQAPSAVSVLEFAPRAHQLGTLDTGIHQMTVGGARGGSGGGSGATVAPSPHEQKAPGSPSPGASRRSRSKTALTLTRGTSTVRRDSAALLCDSITRCALSARMGCFRRLVFAGRRSGSRLARFASQGRFKSFIGI